MNDEDDRIDLKEVCDSENKEKGINNIYENSLQDKMTDHYLHKYHIKRIPFLSSYMKFTSKTWKNNYYLNVRKRIHIFREYSDGLLTLINGRIIILMKRFIQLIQNQIILKRNIL